MGCQRSSGDVYKRQGESKLTDPGTIGMAVCIAKAAGIDPENANGVNLADALTNAAPSAVSSPYNYFYAIEAEKALGLDDTVKALSLSLIHIWLALYRMGNCVQILLDVFLNIPLAKSIGVIFLIIGKTCQPFGSCEDVYKRQAFTKGAADAVLAASLFHFNELPIPELKKYLRENGVSVRM